jgi:hypothetical protein
MQRVAAYQAEADQLRSQKETRDAEYKDLSERFVDQAHLIK